MPANAPRPSPLARARAGDEPAALMSRPSRAKRDRAWERANRAFAYRIDPDLNDAMKAAVDEYARSGWVTNVSLVAAAWLQAGREQWEQGRVDVEGREAPRPGARERNPDAASGM